VVRKTIVGDDRDLLREAFRDALHRVPLMFRRPTCPTEDDLTRETFADCWAATENQRCDSGRDKRLSVRSARMPRPNVRIDGAGRGEPLNNPRGTAPGFGSKNGEH